MLVASAIHRAWTAGLARRDAPGRLAHSVSERSVRLDAAGFSVGRAFTRPLRQTEQAGILGLTNVHVNRVLTGLRALNLFRPEDRRLQIEDRTGLSEIAGLDPGYLHRSSGDSGR